MPEQEDQKLNKPEGGNLDVEKNKIDAGVLRRETIETAAKSALERIKSTASDFFDFLRETKKKLDVKAVAENLGAQTDSLSKSAQQELRTTQSEAERIEDQVAQEQKVAELEVQKVSGGSETTAVLEAVQTAPETVPEVKKTATEVTSEPPLVAEIKTEPEALSSKNENEKPPETEAVLEPEQNEIIDQVRKDAFNKALDEEKPIEEAMEAGEKAGAVKKQEILTRQPEQETASGVDFPAVGESQPPVTVETIPPVASEIQNQAEQIIKDFNEGGVPLVIIRRSRDVLKAYGFTDEEIEKEDAIEILQILKDKVGKEEKEGASPPKATPSVETLLGQEQLEELAEKIIYDYDRGGKNLSVGANLTMVCRGFGFSKEDVSKKRPEELIEALREKLNLLKKERLEAVVKTSVPKKEVEDQEKKKIDTKEEVDKKSKEPEKEEKEKVDAKKKFDFTESFNIKKEELETIAGWQELSEGQKAIVFENLQQLTLARIQADAIDNYNLQQEQQGWLKRMWRGALKKYYVAKEQKLTAEQIAHDGLNSHGEILEKLVDQVKSSGLDAQIKEGGRLEILYCSPNLLKEKGIEFSEEEKEKITQFNNVATKFSKIPYEWSLGRASAKEAKAFKDANNEYEKLREEILELFDSKFDSSMNSLLTVKEIDQKVQMNQFLNTHPEVERKLKEIRSDEVWSRALNSTIFERGGYMLAGAGTRYLTASILGAVAVPAAAAIIGGRLAYKRACENIKEAEEAMRRGKKVGEAKKEDQFVGQRKEFRKAVEEINTQIKEMTGHDARDLKPEMISDLENSSSETGGQLRKLYNEWSKNIEGLKRLDETLALLRAKSAQKDFVDVSILIDKIDRLRGKINSVETGEEKDKLLGSLGARLYYTQLKLEKGQINFGAGKDKLDNQYKLLLSLKQGDGTLTVDGFGNYEELENLENRLGNYLELRASHISTQEKRKLIKQTAIGVGMAAGFASLGYAIISYFRGGHGIVEQAPSKHPPTESPPLKEFPPAEKVTPQEKVPPAEVLFGRKAAGEGIEFSVGKGKDIDYLDQGLRRVVADLYKPEGKIFTATDAAKIENTLANIRELAEGNDVAGLKAADFKDVMSWDGKSFKVLDQAVFESKVNTLLGHSQEVVTPKADAYAYTTKNQSFYEQKFGQQMAVEDFSKDTLVQQAESRVAQVARAAIESIQGAGKTGEYAWAPKGAHITEITNQATKITADKYFALSKDVHLYAMDTDGDGVTDSYVVGDKSEIFHTYNQVAGKTAEDFFDRAAYGHAEIAAGIKSVDKALGPVGKDWATGDKLKIERVLCFTYDGKGNLSESSSRLLHQIVEKFGSETPTLLRDRDLGVYLKDHLSDISKTQAHNLYEQGIKLHQAGWQAIDYKLLNNLLETGRPTDGDVWVTNVKSPLTGKNIQITFDNKNAFTKEAIGQAYNKALYIFRQERFELSGLQTQFETKAGIGVALRTLPDGTIDKVLKLDTGATLLDWKKQFGGGYRDVTVQKLFNELNTRCGGHLGTGGTKGETVAESLAKNILSRPEPPKPPTVTRVGLYEDVSPEQIVKAQKFIEQAEISEQNLKARELINRAKKELGEK